MGARIPQTPPILENGAANGTETWETRRRKVSWGIQGPRGVGAPRSRLVLGGEGGAGRQEGRVRDQTYSRAVEGCDCR